jgi:hypothetical protein
MCHLNMCHLHCRCTASLPRRSQEGSQFCRGFGGVGGILRYQVRNDSVTFGVVTFGVGRRSMCASTCVCCATTCIGFVHL